MRQHARRGLALNAPKRSAPLLRGNLFLENSGTQEDPRNEYALGGIAASLVGQICILF